MSNSVCIIGAGPAGLWTALTLKRRFPDLPVTLIEKESVPGGITASFDYRDLRFDFGSHRLHPATSTEILDDIRNMLGDQLLTRPRHGRIWLEGRFIAFPLKPADLIFNLPFSFSRGVLADTLMGPFRSSGRQTTFAETLLAGLGKTISERFYFPYAEKLWGLPPESLSPVQARKRISSGSTTKMLGKALSSLKGSRRSGGYFYYPAGGFGQIAETACSHLFDAGVNVLLDSQAISLVPPSQDSPGSITLADGTELHSDFIFSTIPVSNLVEVIASDKAPEVVRAADSLRFRSMVFCILEVAGRHYTEYDAHYFPGGDTCFSRLSEPRNYSMAHNPGDRTGLCLEIPCSEGDRLWEMSTCDLTGLVVEQLASTGLPKPEIISSVTKRKSCVYPVYHLDFKVNLSTVESYLNRFNRMISLGRQGLFVHDNTHHTIEMGIAAGQCLDENLEWDHALWADHRRDFEKHVVVD